MNLLRIIIIGALLLVLAISILGFLHGSNEIYKQTQKAKKVQERKVKERTVKERRVKEKTVKEKKLVNPDIVTALQNLGYQKRESIAAAQKAIEKLGEVKIEVLVREALKQI